MLPESFEVTVTPEDLDKAIEETSKLVKNTEGYYEKYASSCVIAQAVKRTFNVEAKVEDEGDIYFANKSWKDGEEAGLIVTRFDDVLDQAKKGVREMLPVTLYYEEEVYD
jgi:hypothetical protein